MDRTAVVEIVLQRAAELLGAEQPGEDLALLGDPRVDSLAVVELVLALEDDLGVDLPEDEVVQAGTLGGLADLALRRRDALAG